MQRTQTDVQRNANQQQRIESGVKNGALTHREASNLERGQARLDRKKVNAAGNGHAGAGKGTSRPRQMTRANASIGKSTTIRKRD